MSSTHRFDTTQGRPHFFMGSLEDEAFGDVRACFILGRLSGPRERGYWRVRVNPGIPVLGRPDAEEVILAERGADSDLAELGAEPISVYVCEIENEAAVSTGSIVESDISLITTAEVSLKSRGNRW